MVLKSYEFGVKTEVGSNMEPKRQEGSNMEPKRQEVRDRSWRCRWVPRILFTRVIGS